MMTRFQDNPEEALNEAEMRLTQAITQLDNNRKSVHRWFWKGLLAMNCVLGSLALWALLLLRLG